MEENEVKGRFLECLFELHHSVLLCWENMQPISLHPSLDINHEQEDQKSGRSLLRIPEVSVSCSSKREARGVVGGSQNRDRTNRTQRATAAYRPLMPTFADRRVSRSQRGGSPTVVISVF
jgi:hypothetical protein